MNSEKNQLLFIGFTILMIILTVLLFLFIGGEFKFLFIHFSANGILNKIIWIVPIIMIIVQQIYVLPAFMKSYWKVFSEISPTIQEIYVPVLNEIVVFESKSIEKFVAILWIIIVLLLIIAFTPILQIFGSGSAVITATFYTIMLSLLIYIIICIIRGVEYLAIRRRIYDYHNIYLGIRGTSPFFWIYRLLYFIPVARSISLLSDIQVLDKITKFNDIDKMNIELKEEI